MGRDHTRAVHRRALIILWLMIALYALNFGVLSVLQNAAYETGAADLGNMNQAAWYTLHMGYPADTFDGQVTPRFSGHVEPIFYLLAIPYALQQTANTLLLLQTVVIALGAIAAYMLGRDVLGRESAGLLFALIYLFFPSLQAANLTEFHPVALAAPLLLFAFYYLQKRSYPSFFFFALLAMSTKEDMSLLVAMLGLYAVVLALRSRRQPPPERAGAEPRAGIVAGLAAVIIGAGWFVVTVYAIIPHFSTSGGVVLFQRYAEVGGSPQGLVGTLLRHPLDVLARALQPAKIAYVAGLLLSAGFLTLGAPWALVLAAPSLGINLLSNYPPMYSGLSHYSAPIVPFIVIGAVYGARWLSGVLGRRLTGQARRASLWVLGWLLLCAAIYQVLVGFTPFSLRYRIPSVTTHDHLLARFAQQIPPAAALSVQSPLAPHLSSRALIYPFPVVNDAEYVLVDVTARPTMHPNDLKGAVDKLISQDGYGVLDAADGYILLQRGAAQKTLPQDFYSAFRTAMPHPQHAVVADFGPYLRLLGYDIIDVDEGRQPWTKTRFYFQVESAPPDDLHIYPYYLDDAGNTIEDTTERPLVASLWYPPVRWQQGDILVMETLPWPLGDRFRLALGVMHGDDWRNASARLPVQLVKSERAVYPLDGGTAIELGSFRRIIDTLAQVGRPTPRPSHPTDARLGDEIRLLGYDLHGAEGGLRGGETVDLTLYWQALVPPQTDYHTFAHIYDSSGNIAAQSDGVTGNADPSSWWAEGQVVTETRSITIPSTAPSGLGQAIEVGLYRLDTGVRLPVTDARGQSGGDMITLPVK